MLNQTFSYPLPSFHSACFSTNVSELWSAARGRAWGELAHRGLSQGGETNESLASSIKLWFCVNGAALHQLW